MLKEHLGPMLRMDFKLVPDTDFEYKSAEGRVSTGNIDALDHRMKTAGIQRSENSNQRIIVYQLPQKLPETDYNALAMREEELIKSANKLVVPEEKYPVLNRKQTELESLTYAMVGELDKMRREAFGFEMLREMRRLTILLSRVERGAMEFDEYFVKAMDVVENFYGEVRAMLSRRANTGKKMYNLTQAIVDFEKSLKVEQCKKQK